MNSFEIESGVWVPADERNSDCQELVKQGFETKNGEFTVTKPIKVKPKKGKDDV